MVKISYGDQEHSRLYIRKDNDSKEHIYLDYEEAKELYKALEKYVSHVG